MPSLERVPGIRLEYEFLAGRQPVVMFCPGFASDMGGTKALALRAACIAKGQAFLRFDYSGHGQSGGRLIEGCISDWAADAAFVLNCVAPSQKILLAGSSMGGWIALLLAPGLGARLAGLLLIAPAPDFTEALVRPALSAAQQAQLAQDGVLYNPNPYGEPVPMTQKLLEDGAKNLVLAQPLPVACKVRILHGMADPDVPWRLSLKLCDVLATPDVRLVLVKDGDHRLSRDDDLQLLQDVFSTL